MLRRTLFTAPANPTKLFLKKVQRRKRGIIQQEANQQAKQQKLNKKIRMRTWFNVDLPHTQFQYLSDTLASSRRLRTELVGISDRLGFNADLDTWPGY